MAAASLQGWRTWNALAGENLYLQCGGIDAGPEGSRMVAAAENLCREYGQPFKVFTGAEFNREHPHFNLPAAWRAIYQPESGVVRPDATRAFLYRQARASGARLLFHDAVLEIESSSTSVRVQTTKETLTADTLIVAAGSWLPTLLPELNIPLSTERRVLAWFDPSPAQNAGNHLDINHSPIFILDIDGGWYGMPTPGGRFKIGHDKHLHQVIDPDQPPINPGREDATLLSSCIRNYFTGIDPEPREMKPCIYTLTSDHHFLIDHHPSHANILIFSCCSGHGFKYAPSYGQIAADLLAGKPRPDLAQFSFAHLGGAAIRYSS
jgi:sarcosine oxidase